ncbi:tetratricopeptide repeat protein [Ottowia sp.]|uniref:tetratricopeptide repeat protein n=1 Tax=Ottowia sp. TaxID=1898956 RepID=UPI003A87CF54
MNPFFVLAPCIRRHLIPAACLIASLSVWAPAWADDYAEVQQLQTAGKTSEALARADQYIAAHPGDPQMRFIKANLLSSQQRTDEAEALLTQLTRDTPELAEPWNNLAVLHAARGQLNQARQELQEALRIHPNYATALENLGDVQTRLALQAFEHAQKLDAKNHRLAAKINALRNATATSTASLSTSPTTPPSTPTSAASPASAPAPQSRP